MKLLIISSLSATIGFLFGYYNCTMFYHKLIRQMKQDIIDGIRDRRNKFNDSLTSTN